MEVMLKRYQRLLSDLIEITILENLAPLSSAKEMEDWYQYALSMDCIEYIYDSSELIGFLDWVRLPRIPVSRQDARQLFYLSPGGPVLMALNAYVSELAPAGTLRKLVTRVWDKNPGVEHACFHRRRTDQFKVYTNVRGKLCKEIAVC